MPVAALPLPVAALRLSHLSQITDQLPVDQRLFLGRHIGMVAVGSSLPCHTNCPNCQLALHSSNATSRLRSKQLGVGEQHRLCAISTAISRSINPCGHVQVVAKVGVFVPLPLRKVVGLIFSCHPPATQLVLCLFFCFFACSYACSFEFITVLCILSAVLL